MGFTRFLKGSDPKGVGVQIVEESTEQDFDISDYYEGIYNINSYGSYFFDVTFIPQFERKNDLWYQHELFEYEDVSTDREARLLIATDRSYSVTPDVNRAGTKQEFIIPLTPEQEADLKIDRLNPKDFTHKTIYYVSYRDFYTFRGEIVTIKSERNMATLDLINIREISDFSFIQFILNNIVPPEKLEELQEKAGIDFVKEIK